MLNKPDQMKARQHQKVSREGSLIAILCICGWVLPTLALGQFRPMEIDAIDSIRIRHIDFTDTREIINCCGKKSDSSILSNIKTHIVLDTTIRESKILAIFKCKLDSVKQLKKSNDPCIVDAYTIVHIFYKGQIKRLCIGNNDEIDVRGKYYESRDVFDALIYMIGPKIYPDSCRYCPAKWKYSKVREKHPDW